MYMFFIGDCWYRRESKNTKTALRSAIPFISEVVWICIFVLVFTNLDFFALLTLVVVIVVIDEVVTVVTKAVFKTEARIVKGFVIVVFEFAVHYEKW